MATKPDRPMPMTARRSSAGLDDLAALTVDSDAAGSGPVLSFSQARLATIAARPTRRFNAAALNTVTSNPLAGMSQKSARRQPATAPALLRAYKAATRSRSSARDLVRNRVRTGKVA